MRKLASIRRIAELHPITNRDRIELAIVDGWSVIVKKGEYKVGDATIFIETDSIVPSNAPYFEFLAKAKFRIKTMKMAGVVSQGLCAPLSLLNQNTSYCSGTDVTEELGIIQWDNAISESEQGSTNDERAKKYPKWLMRHKWFRKLVLPKKKDKGFPAYITKSDENRIQNLPYLLKDKTVLWTVREKLDGQSATYVLKRRKRFLLQDKFEFIVCSRNMRRGREDNSSFWQVARKYGIKKKLRDRIGEYDFVCVQGEIIGPKIQGNKYGLGDYEFYVFNTSTNMNKDDGARHPDEDCLFLGLVWCPIITTIYTMPDTVSEVLEFATGKSLLANVLREGVVLRNSKGASTKAVSPKFLLKHDE